MPTQPSTIKENQMSYEHFMLHKLPTIKEISSYSQREDKILIKSQHISNNFLPTNNKTDILLKFYKQIKSTIITKDGTKKEVLSEINKNKILIDYPPLFGNRDRSSYFPNDTGDILPFSGGIIEFAIPEHAIEKQPLVFEVTINDLDPTPIKEPNMLDNNLPFETSVEITVHEPTYTDLINIISPELHTDMKNSIYGPSYEGINIYDSNYIFRLQIEISNAVRSKLQYFTHTLDEPYLDQLKEVIRKEVHDQLINLRVFCHLRAEDLKNTNHILNLLINEMIVNSIFVSEEEKFILQNIVVALIVEIQCHFEGVDPFTYYLDESQVKFLVDNVMMRFLDNYD
jgi:hypothetical protein